MSCLAYFLNLLFQLDPRRVAEYENPPFDDIFNFLANHDTSQLSVYILVAQEIEYTFWGSFLELFYFS